MSKLIGAARTLPGFVVGTTFSAARLPFDAAARIARRDDEWEPRLAVDGAQAAVETTVGGLLRDDRLVSKGRLRQARIDKLRQAARLETVAEQTRDEAADELEARRDAAERRREQAEQTAEQREEQLEKQKAARKTAARKTASKREQAVSAQVEATEEVLERQDRAGQLAAAEAESAALATERAALSAEDRALEADAAIEESREARSGG